MRWVDFLDKERGTVDGLAHLPLSDSANSEYRSGDPSFRCTWCSDTGVDPNGAVCDNEGCDPDD
jgi:hypothetical protein